MFEPTQRQVDNDIARSMAMFQRAEVGEISPMARVVPQRVLLAVDGSSQDAQGVVIAGQLKERLTCELFVTDARENLDESTSQLASSVSQQLQAKLITSKGDAAYDKIFAAVAECDADLLIAPCPFGRDLKSVGADSTGTVVDVLLARSPVPVLLTRGSFEEDVDILRRARLILSGENSCAPTAAQWTLGLMTPKGDLQLMLLVETEFFDNVREALHALHPDEADISVESLEDALAKIHSRLHSRLQATSDELGFSYQLLIEHEQEDLPFSAEATASYLVVLPIEADDHASQSHAHDLIRRSTHPVMIVPRAGERRVEN